MTHIIFSIYHKETKSPTDRSYLCSLDWSNPKAVKSLLTDGRVSGLSRRGNQLWVGVGTGVKRFDLKTKKFAPRQITHPLINQTHSIHATKDKLYLCSTGLDLLLVFDHQGKLLQTWHPKHGKSLDHIAKKDYRLIDYKKTGHNFHHVNHVTSNDKYVFVNCGKTSTIHQLTHDLDLVKKVKLETLDSPFTITHDGLLQGDWLVLTESNGFLWKWNYKTGVIKKIPLATKWLRGLAVHQNNYIIGLTSTEKNAPSRILQTDFSGTKIKEVKLKCPIQPPMVYSVVPFHEGI